MCAFRDFSTLVFQIPRNKVFGGIILVPTQVLLKLLPTISPKNCETKQRFSVVQNPCDYTSWFIPQSWEGLVRISSPNNTPNVCFFDHWKNWTGKNHPTTSLRCDFKNLIEKMVLSSGHPNMCTREKPAQKTFSLKRNTHIQGHSHLEFWVSSPEPRKKTPTFHEILVV